MQIKIQHFFHETTNTFTYVVYDQVTKDAVIIDPVWDFSLEDFSLTGTSAQEVLNFIKKNLLQVHYLLETHVHADHITGASLLKAALSGSKIAINQNVTQVQQLFKKLWDLSDFDPAAVHFDLLLTEEKVLTAGSLNIQTLFTPGHTRACSCFLIQDALFVGDTIFMPDAGTGRCDFPGGSAQMLFKSITEKIYSLPDETRIFVGHDYGPGGRDIACETTVGQERRGNIHISQDSTLTEFLEFRTRRDAELKPPRLIYPSVQLNLRAGSLPPKTAETGPFIKMPLTVIN